MRGFVSVGGVLIVTIGLSGCQSVNSDLGQVNKGLSVLTGDDVSTPVSTAKTTKKSNPGHRSQEKSWRVSGTEALSWLSQDQESWDDKGKLKGVNWYEFWSQQVHSNSALSRKAYQYCHASSWSGKTPGANCKVFFQAYTMSKTAGR